MKSKAKILESVFVIFVGLGTIAGPHGGSSPTQDAL